MILSGRSLSGAVPWDNKRRRCDLPKLQGDYWRTRPRDRDRGDIMRLGVVSRRTVLPISVSLLEPFEFEPGSLRLVRCSDADKTTSYGYRGTRYSSTGTGNTSYGYGLLCYCTTSTGFLLLCTIHTVYSTPYSTVAFERTGTEPRPSANAMEFLDMEKFTSILCLFVCLFTV
jgi:hypothetical protein